jgi:hypothetical protein
MKERSLAERIVAILGVLAGTIVWVVRLLISMLQGLVKNLTGSAKSSTKSDEDETGSGVVGNVAGSVTDNVTQFTSAARQKSESVVSDAKHRVDSMIHPDTAKTSGASETESSGVLEPSPGETPASGLITGQHDDIGGIPEAPGMAGTLGQARSQGQTRPLEEQGYDEETGAQLTQGIPNLEEPGGDNQDVYGSEAGALLDSDAPVSDYAGYAKSESDVGVDRSSQLSDLADTPDNDLQGGVDTYDTIDAGDTGSDEDRDAVASTTENHIPAAGRGWQEPEDPLAGDPLYGDFESSEAGGEVDLRNDEADDEISSGMHIVESPDEPFLEDETAAQELGFVDSAGDPGFGGMLDEIDDVTNLESAAIDENLLAADATGRAIGGDAASGDLGGEESFDDTLRDPGESVGDYDITGVRAGSGVDPFADDAIAEDMLSDIGSGNDTLVGNEQGSGDTDGSTGSDEGSAQGQGTESVAWASSAGVIDRDLTQPLPPEELQTGSDMSQAEAERIIDADDQSGAPGSRKELQGEFMVDGTESEAVKSPQVEEPQDAALRDVAAEMAEDIEVGGPEVTDETPGDSGQDVQERGSGSVDTNAGQGQSASRPRGRQASAPEGSVRGDGTAVCPADYPIKGNAKSRIYHRPTDPSYDNTVPEFCFATEDAAKAAGFRARKL